MMVRRPSPSDELDHLRLAVTIAGLRPNEIVLPKHDVVAVRDLTLNYLDWGSGGRQPILFLHGGGLTAHSWDLVCVALQDSYRCIALDQRGHGESGWTPDRNYELEDFVADIEALVEQLQLYRPVLVGQSLGGINALGYAASHANELTALVIVEAGTDVRWEDGQRIRDFVSETTEVRSLEEFVERARGFNPKRDPRLLRHSLLHNLRALPDGRLMRKSDPRLLTAFRTNFYQRLDSIDEQIDAITCPSLVVRGADSEVFSDQQAERLAQRLRGHWVRLEGAGHTVQGDNPRALTTVLRAFLTDALSSETNAPS
jgi:esterase